MPGRYFRLLCRFAAVSFRDTSEFRLDFFTSVLHYLVYQALFIVFWKSILGFTGGALGGWTFPDLVVLTAFTLLATAILQWFEGFEQLSGKVLTGGLDKYLSKPVSPLFALLAEELNGVASVQQLASGLILLGGVCLYFDVRITLLGSLASLALLVLGCLVLTLLRGCLALLSFWLGDVSRITQLLNVSNEVERYPINLFPPWLRSFLTWILPIGLISTFPVLVFVGKTDAAVPFLAIGAVLVLCWSGIFAWTWRHAVARYESFGG